MSVVWLRWLKCGLPIGVLFVIGQGLIWFGIVGLAIGAVAWLTGFGDFWGDPGAPQGPIKKWGAWVILIGALVFGARKGWQEGIDFKVWLATSSKRFRRYREEKEFGKGGSSAFAGVVEDWRHRWYSGDVLLGKSLNEAFWWVGWQDDRGFLTVAGSRSGKGRSAIIPNLLLWPGSALVIDPKGTNAAVTAARRGLGGGRVTQYLGQKVYVVDPFGIVKNVKSARFNPMAAINPKSPEFAEEIEELVDALIIQEREGEASHWDETARTLIAGVMSYLVQTRPGSTLVDLRNALTLGGMQREKLFEAMMKQGGLARSAAALIQTAGPNERGSIFTTTLRNTRWLESRAMQRVLSASDFDIRDIKKEAMTVYVVLPPNLLETHSRFMRMFVNLANRGMSQGPKPAHPVLFVLDEFFALGRLALMEKSAGLMAGFGLKLWPIVQNMGQLRHLYPRNWEAFVANAGAVQAFWRQRQYDVRVSDRADGQDGAPGSDREFYPAGCRGIARNAGGRARGIAADEQATGVSLWRAANGA
jgi:type IV secretory pathway TraG/TraD family ATPase VirD4